MKLAPLSGEAFRTFAQLARGDNNVRSASKEPQRAQVENRDQPFLVPFVNRPCRLQRAGRPVGQFSQNIGPAEGGRRLLAWHQDIQGLREFAALVQRQRIFVASEPVACLLTSAASGFIDSVVVADILIILATTEKSEGKCGETVGS